MFLKVGYVIVPWRVLGQLDWTNKTRLVYKALSKETWWLITPYQTLVLGRGSFGGVARIHLILGYSGIPKEVLLAHLIGDGLIPEQLL